MPIKAYYSLEPGKVVVAEEIASRYPSLQVFFPQEDKGVDLIVLGDMSRAARYPLTIQVKESRYYGDSPKVHSWHQVHKSKLEDLIEEMDFFVFMTYVDLPKGNKMGFRKEFIIVSAQDLAEICRTKKSSKDIYSFYFSFQYDSNWTKVLDVRDMKENWQWDKAPSYSNYYDNWDQIVDTLEDEEDIRGGLRALADPEESISWETFKEDLMRDSV